MSFGHTNAALTLYNEEPFIIAGVYTNYNSDVEKLSNFQQKWSTMAPLPYPLEGHSAVSIDKIFVFGTYVEFKRVFEGS